MRSLVILGCLCIFSTFGIAQSSDERSLIAAVENLRKAMVDANQNMLSELTSDKLSYGHSSGKIEDKETFINSLTSGASDFVNIRLKNQSIIIVGSTGIVRHTLEGVTNDNNKAGTVKLGILLVFNKNGQDWQLVARQAVKVLP